MSSMSNRGGVWFGILAGLLLISTTYGLAAEMKVRINGHARPVKTSSAQAEANDQGSSWYIRLKLRVVGELANNEAAFKEHFESPETYEFRDGWTEMDSVAAIRPTPLRFNSHA